MNNKPTICYPQRSLICHGGQVRGHFKVCGLYDLDLLLIPSTLGGADVGTDTSLTDVRAILLLLSIHHGALSKQTGTLIWAGMRLRLTKEPGIAVSEITGTSVGLIAS